MKRFEDLKAWQLGRKYRREIYHISEGFPVEEKFQLIAQIRDAACSITANIAEGYERNSNKNFIQFLYISKGSLNKLMTFSLAELDDKFEKKLTDWKSKIQIMQYNISSRFNGKFVFFDPINLNSLPKRVTGKDSFNSIQVELFNCLHTYKANIEWFKNALQNNKNKDLNYDINKMLKFLFISCLHFHKQLIKLFS